MKNKTKNETEEKMDLLDTDTQNDIYKIKKKTKDLEDEKYDDIDTIYEQYRIEDIDFISESSNEDIDSKMNKLIQIKKKGGNLLDYIHNKEISKLQQLKLIARNLQEQKIKKQKKEQKLMKMKKGLEKLKLIFPKVMRNIAYRKLTKKMKYKFCIEYGFDKFRKFYNIRTRNIKKINYNKFLKYSKDNKIKKKKEKQEKERQEKEKQEKEKQEKEKQEKENQEKEKQKKEKQKKEKQEKEQKEKEKKEKERKEKQDKEKKEKEIKEKQVKGMKEKIIKLKKEKEIKEKLVKENQEKENKKEIENKELKENIDKKRKSIEEIKKISPSSNNKIEENKIGNIIDRKDNKNKMPILNEKGKKIFSKKEKLEILKKKEEDYINQVNLQSKLRFEEMKVIEDQLDKQKLNYKKINEGLDVSLTDSNITNKLEYNSYIQNGFEILNNLFNHHINRIKKHFIHFLRKINKKRRFKKYESLVNLKIGQNAIDKLSQKKVSKMYQSEKNLNKTITDSDDFSNQYYLHNQQKKMEINVEEVVEENSSDIERENEDSRNEDTFIKINGIEKIECKVDKSQLVEYDIFYKEQFFKNDVFKYDVNNIQDKEVKEINHEMNKLEAKRKLIAKKKEKDVLISKGLDTDEIDIELESLEKEYLKAKTIEKPKLDLIMNNTEGLLYKGRILGCYFNGNKEIDFPTFALESEKEIGAKEVIDFKILRKEEVVRRFFDYCCCLEERKKINKILVYTRYWCRFFVDSWIFDNLSLLIIILNTFLILISDPTDSENIGNEFDQYFLYFYTLEAILKIISFKFFNAEDAYIKDYWNILDFFVVLVGWISLIIERMMNGTKITGLAGLRAFRILRPLKTVKRFKDLKKLVTALLASIAHLGETTIVLIFFFLIFAIAGRQMWQGMFYRRCMSLNYGYLYSTHKDKQMCSFDTDCEELNTYGMRYVCAKGYLNPDSGAISFDNTLVGFVTIFVMVTLEGWTNIFTYVSKTFKDKIHINSIIVFFYFHVFIFLGSFYLINLFLAVTNSEFEHIETERKLLSEKKSFYKLIISKFDLKEKEKQEKKEKNKKKKENNNRKSDQALVDLYYKVKDEAFQINKNRRNIPVLYSTVKDMYIMSNNNPEELYLQDLRIDDEESFLGKDIKRQQKEIDALIDEKRKEAKMTAKDKKKEEQKDNENIDKINTQQSKQSKAKALKTVKSLKSTNSNIKKTNTGGYSSLRNNTKNNESIPDNIIKLMNKINKEMINDSISNTIKQMKERKIIYYHKKREEENNENKE